MKYMILSYGSQRDYDGMAGKESTWTAADFAAMTAFMAEFTNRLAESGELVETRGLAEPARTRRLGNRAGAPFVTDGPYAETQEVLAGYWVVECADFDRATEIAGGLAACPGPPEVTASAYCDVRPVMEQAPEFG
ncbi:hypothetical protein D5S18_05645 [Nocardia panacis]|uniref:YCII-related domain-containing protein n=1 Tax=Nocardia panacis TaxID=2340916 RepID=A0A3A4KGE7_9NOCA|nr:YciI family protein [Nocardia panacis]RJO78384.1 hypothetical protein D5S18_05645 [Nocardia panacis]